MSGFPAVTTNNPTFTGTATMPDGSVFTGTAGAANIGANVPNPNQGLANVYDYLQLFGGMEFESVFSWNQTHSITSAAAYVPKVTDVVIINPAGLNRTVAPDASTFTGPIFGNFPTFILITKGAGAITITPTSGETINGQASFVLPGHSACILWCDSVNWWTIGPTGGTNTSVAAVVSTPTPTTGTAFTPSANQDCELSFAVSTAATFTVTYGPSTGAENTILSSTALPIGTFFNKTIPAGWKVVITGTIADLENILAVTC